MKRPQFFFGALKDLLSASKSFFKNEYFRSPIVRWLLLFIGAANLANWLLLYFGVKPAENPIILHYNVYFGVDLMGSWRNTFILPATGAVLFVINGGLSMFLYHNQERIAAYLLLIAAFMIQLSLLIASFSVVIINY